MIKIDLTTISHNTKVGDVCEYIEPNVREDSIFYLNDKPIGYYISNIEGKCKQYLEIANNEFLSKRVPKSMMARSSAIQTRGTDELGVEQYSTILGGVLPKPHMRRPYPTISSVHNVDSAKTFIKAMLLLVNEAESILHDIMPEQYETQLEIFSKVPDKWKFGKLFTSSISNFNISAPFHIDKANFKNTINVIFTKRHNSKGGCLNVPDYDATIEQTDNSMLVYPAWANIHGVTPIVPLKEKGYRNSLIFYPLNGFQEYV